MTEFDRAREQMVDSQLRASGVFDWRILGQMKSISREMFVAPARQSLAYADEVQWFGQRGASRFMVAPATLARLLKLAEVGPNEDALVVGATTGYAMAVVAGLAKSVVGLESDTDLADRAADNLKQLKIDNAQIVAGDFAALGRQQFDVIILEGAVDSVSKELLERLSSNGRLIAIVRVGAVGVARVYVNTAGSIAIHDHFNATVPPLITTKAEEHFVF